MDASLGVKLALKGPSPGLIATFTYALVAVKRRVGSIQKRKEKLICSLLEESEQIELPCYRATGRYSLCFWRLFLNKPLLSVGARKRRSLLALALLCARAASHARDSEHPSFFFFFFFFLFCFVARFQWRNSALRSG